MKSKGRPATRPAKLMDGFYIEVRNRGTKDKGVKIRSVTKEQMEATAAHYLRSNKEVNVLGEHKNDKWLNEKPATKKSKEIVEVSADAGTPKPAQSLPPVSKQMPVKAETKVVAKKPVKKVAKAKPAAKKPAAKKSAAQKSAGKKARKK